MLDSLHIKASAQGMGAGKKPIFKVGKYAYENGYDSMVICIVRRNDKAGDIYTHLGAKFLKNFTDDFEGTSVNSTLFIWEDLEIFS